MDAIIIAGGKMKSDDPLYQLTGVENKASILVAGKPMIQWVIDALNMASMVDSIIVVGFDQQVSFQSRKPVYEAPCGETLMDSVLSGLRKMKEFNPGSEYGLVVSVDIPAITGEMIDWFIEQTSRSGIDLYYSVITRDKMEQHYPGSGRSFIRFSDVVLCGGDIHVLNTRKLDQEDNVWKRLSESRKSPLKLILIIGAKLLFQSIFKRPTLEGAVKTICSRLKIDGRVVICPYAEIGMDVDKISQLKMIESNLIERSKGDV